MLPAFASAGTNSPAFLAETKALLARFTTVAPLTHAVRLNRLIKRMKDAGIWARTDACWCLAAHHEQAARRNIVADTFNLTAVNSPSFVAYAGFKGDGVSAYLDPTLTPSTATLLLRQNDVAIYFWNTFENEGPSSTVDIGATSGGGGQNLSIRFRFGVNASIGGMAGATDDVRVATATGLTGFSRDNSANFRRFRSGGTGTITRTSSGLPTAPFRILRLSGSGNYSLMQVPFGWMGRSLDEDQEHELYSAALEFLISSGAVTEDDQTFPADPDPPHQWARGDITTITTAWPGINVSWQVPPPASDAITNTGANAYAYYPANAFTSQDIASIIASTCTLGPAFHLMFAARKSGQHNPNEFPIYPAIKGDSGANSQLQCRISFSTYARAMAHDEIRFRYSLNYSDASIVAAANAVGLTAVAPFDDYTAGDVITWAEASAEKNSTALFTTVSSVNPLWVYCTDKVTLPTGRITSASATLSGGILYDAENQDERAPADQLAHVQNLAALCANAPGGAKQFALYLNPLDGPGAGYSGFDRTNLYLLHQDPHVSFISILVIRDDARSPLTQINAQLDMLRGVPADGETVGTEPIDYSKIMLVVGIGADDQEMTDAQCLEINDWIDANRPGWLMFFRYNAVVGGLIADDWKAVRVAGIVTGLYTP